MEENLNIDDNIGELVVKALNKVKPPIHANAAKLLGVSERQVYHYIDFYRLSNFRGRWISFRKLMTA